MLKQILRGSVYVGGSTLGALFLEYLYQLFMAHYLSPDDFGLLGVSLAVLGILTIVLTYGVGFSLAKFISEDVEINRVRDYIFNGVLLELIIVVSVSVLLFIVSLFLLPFLGVPDLLIPLTLVSVILPFYVFSALSGNLFQGLQRMFDLSVTMLLNALVKVAVSVLLVYLAFGLFGALAGFFAGSLVAIFYLLIRLNTYISFRSVDFSLIQRLVFFSFHVSIAVIIFNILLRSDSILLKFLGVPNTVIGLYLGSALVSRVAYYVCFAVSLVVLPAVSSSQEKLRLRPLFFSLFVLLLLGNLFTVLFSKHIIALLFPDSFVSASFVLPFLVFGMSVLGVGSILLSVVFGLGFPKLGTINSLFGLLVYLISFFVLVPSFGIIGSAVSLIFGSLALSVPTALLLRKKLASQC